MKKTAFSLKSCACWQFQDQNPYSHVQWNPRAPTGTVKTNVHTETSSRRRFMYSGYQKPCMMMTTTTTPTPPPTATTTCPKLGEATLLISFLQNQDNINRTSTLFQAKQFVLQSPCQSQLEALIGSLAIRGKTLFYDL